MIYIVVNATRDNMWGTPWSSPAKAKDPRNEGTRMGSDPDSMLSFQLQNTRLARGAWPALGQVFKA
mgnify:CR=1 FL=1